MLVSVVDIETCGFVEELQYLDYKYLKNRGREKTDEDVEKGLSFNPYLLYVISLAVTQVRDDTIEEAIVYYLTSQREEEHYRSMVVGEEKVEVSYHPILCPSVPRDLADGEQILLTSFWEEIRESEKLVTYSGRVFDVPVLRLRSMLHHLPVRKELEASFHGRGGDFHLDLADFLAWRDDHKYTLEFVCRRFDIPLGKANMDGSMVKEAFLGGRYREIAEYNCRDSVMTALLYLKLWQYLVPEEGNMASERQIEYLADLMTSLGGGERESVRRILSWIRESGILVRERASHLIRYLKSLGA